MVRGDRRPDRSCAERRPERVSQFLEDD